MSRSRENRDHLSSNRETEHHVVVGDSRHLAQVDDDSIELVVTSPPYPMIEMWDELFADLNPEIGDQLEAGDGQAAFGLMHKELSKVWDEVSRVLVDGGLVCINIGDATRRVDGNFRLYPNHCRIVDAFETRGFDSLPGPLWQKPANSCAAFLGSGTLPPNAYVTLEHEHILIFRKGNTQRTFKPNSERRYKSAYFFEERNQWFPDSWKDIQGELQSLEHGELRDRSAAYPFEIPYRLINMFSVYGDTVLDPFWGTGTTSLAAMVAARNSIGYEIEEHFTGVFDKRVSDVPRFSRTVVRKRLNDHCDIIEETYEAGDTFKYEAENYGFPVKSGSEKQLQFYSVESVEETAEGYRTVHEPVEDEGVDLPAENEGGRDTTFEDF